MKRFVKILCSGMITTSMLLSSVSVFANTTERVVKISTGNQIAIVNGENVTLSVAPYVQQPSNSMMIPLRFVSTALGIPEENIQYNANTKEVTIKYNSKEIKFIVGTSKMYINGEDFDMVIVKKETGKNIPIYTEIKNGSTFIPLRALDAVLGVKIEWEGSTKTAIMTNIINIIDENVENNNEPTINEIETNTNQNIEENNNTTESNEPKELTEEEKRAMEEEVVKLVNEEREKHGLQPLQISEKLMQTAREKSDDMAINNYSSHTDPNGYNMAKDMNVAENIAGVSSTPKGVFNEWLSSNTGHKENILDPNSKYIGVGVAYNIDSKYMYYWTQQFSSDDKWANEN